MSVSLYKNNTISKFWQKTTNRQFNSKFTFRQPSYHHHKIKFHRIAFAVSDDVAPPVFFDEDPNIAVLNGIKMYVSRDNLP